MYLKGEGMKLAYRLIDDNGTFQFDPIGVLNDKDEERFKQIVDGSAVNCVEIDFIDINNIESFTYLDLLYYSKNNIKYKVITTNTLLENKSGCNVGYMIGSTVHIKKLLNNNELLVIKEIVDKMVEKIGLFIVAKELEDMNSSSVSSIKFENKCTILNVDDF